MRDVSNTNVESAVSRHHRRSWKTVTGRWFHEGRPGDEGGNLLLSSGDAQSVNGSIIRTRPRKKKVADTERKVHALYVLMCCMYNTCCMCLCMIYVLYAFYALCVLYVMFVITVLYVLYPRVFLTPCSE